MCLFLHTAHIIHQVHSSESILLSLQYSPLPPPLSGVQSPSLLPLRTFPSVVRWNSPALSRKQARSWGYRSRLVVEPRPPVAGLRSSPRTWSMVGQSSLARAAALAASPFCLESDRTRRKVCETTVASEASPHCKTFILP